MPQIEQTRRKADSACTLITHTGSSSGRNLTDYEYVYTYRSEAAARHKTQVRLERPDYLRKDLPLAERLRRRNEYMNRLVVETLNPTVGSTSVFSTTDTGHPFAKRRVTVNPSDGWFRVSNQSGSTFSNAFGVIPRAADYFLFPRTGGIGGGYVSTFPARNRLLWHAFPGTVDIGAGYQGLDNDSARALGTKVIASCDPFKPQASLAVTLGELLLGSLPSLVKNVARWKSGTSSLMSAGSSEYLNVQFGWLPLISDIQNAIETLLKLDMLLHTSDEKRRQRYGSLGEFHDSSESLVSYTYATDAFASNSTLQGGIANANSGVSLGAPRAVISGKILRTGQIYTDYRFSGRFHLGVRSTGTNGYVDRAIEFLGLKLTPQVVWQLAPWTWLMDWASNLGAIAQNLNSMQLSNVLLDYAYLTVRSRYTGTSTLEVSSVSGYLTGKADCSRFNKQMLTIEETVREGASPFGFSFSWAGLSQFQLSILAALGMSRAR